MNRFIAPVFLVGLALAKASMPALAQDIESNGYLVVPDQNWRHAGAPPKLELCVAQKEHRGVISNTYECTWYVGVEDYLAARYPGKSAKLTHWEFQCLASGGRWTQCDKVVVLYYRVP